jgi:hypothetical protein
MRIQRSKSLSLSALKVVQTAEKKAAGLERIANQLCTTNLQMLAFHFEET